MDLSGSPPLGLAHFTAIAVPPLELVSLAARTGYAAVGLRLYPAFPGAPFYEIPAGSAASHEMQERLRGKGVRVYDIEFVTLSQGFAPLPSSCPGRLRGGPGERWRVGRRVASFAHRRNARGRAPNAGAQLCDAVAERPSSNEAIIQEARSDRLLPGRGTLPLCDLLDVLPTETVVSV